MDEREFGRQIALAWDLFDKKLDAGRAFIWTNSLPVDADFRRIALAPESSYSEIYKMGLSKSTYNFVLVDYSYFQFSWDSDASWRLAYFPNPWITGVTGASQIVNQWEALEQMGDLTHEEASELIDELPYRGAVPSIRFEYSRAQYREIAHPAAHFHLGRNADNRWACALLLGPLAFSMLVARLYYAEQWRPLSSYEGNTPKECLDRAFLAVVEATQAVHEFSSSERNSLHFGRNLVAVGEPRSTSLLQRIRKVGRRANPE